MSSKGRWEAAWGGVGGVRGMVAAVARRYQPSLPLQWPAGTLASSPLGTQGSSSLQWAVSDFTAPPPRHQTFSLEDALKWGRLQLQKCSSLPLSQDGKSPVVPPLSVGPYLLLNLLSRGHNVTLILTTVGQHHIYSAPCCQTGLCWCIPSVGSCCLQSVAQWVSWLRWLECNEFMICSVHRGLCFFCGFFFIFLFYLLLWLLLYRAVFTMKCILHLHRGSWVSSLAS